MNPELIERVMNCRDLPTLPAVAMRVVELTNSEKIVMKELAEVIQNDQALSAKILRTVNSSLFGLRTRCASINQAIVMLGLATVKTLALGFSLVGALKDCGTGGFDIADHWRRALYTGIAARSIAAKAGLANPEEAFLGGLLQDLGVIAMVRTLGSDYAAVLAGAAGDHRKLSKNELEKLEIQHSDVGAMLARRWKLPESLVMPIKYHEKATAAPMEHSSVCRAVGLGNIAAEVLSASEPAEPLRRFYQRAEQWFGLTTMQADDVLKLITQQTREAATLLSVPTGSVKKAEEVIEKARAQLAAVEIQSPEDETTRPGADDRGHDELTGAANRFRLEQILLGAFEQTKSGAGPLSLAIFDIDGLDEINTQFGTDAGDTVLISVAGRLDRTFKSTGGVIARYDGGRMAVAMPKTERAMALSLCEQARTAIAGDSVRLIAASHGSPSQINATCSVGLASVDQQSIQRFEDLGQLTQIVEQAVRAAKKAGKNAIRVYAPAQAA